MAGASFSRREPQSRLDLADRKLNQQEYTSRVFVAAAVAATFLIVAALVWYARHIVLMAFGGVLLAVFLQAISSWVSRYTRLPYAAALGIVVLVLVALIGLILLVFGAQLSQQVGELAQTLPESMAALHERLQQTQWGRWLLDEAPGASQVLSQTDAFSRMTGAATSLMHGLVGLIVVLFVGLYGAAAPGMYLEGMVRLFPFSRRERAREALQTLGYSLRRWLLGQLFTMLLVGVLIGVGLWLLGVRQALALGLIAFVLELIPNFGPVLAAVPALLIAWSQGTTTLVYVLVLYVGAQALESYVVNPLVQQRAVWMPPILTLLAIVFFGLIGGLIGAFVATPLMLSIVVLVKLLYVEDLLGDRSIEVPGEPE